MCAMIVCIFVICTRPNKVYNLVSLSFEVVQQGPMMCVCVCVCAILLIPFNFCSIILLCFLKFVCAMIVLQCEADFCALYYCNM
jgi:hypothetical protein